MESIFGVELYYYRRSIKIMAIVGLMVNMGRKNQ